MRIFRIKARSDKNRVLNQREYIGLEKLRAYGHEVWRRYNRYSTAEVYELNEKGKWILITDELAVRKLLNPYGSD